MLPSLCLLAVVFFSICIVPSSVVGQTNNVIPSLQAANDAVGQAFNAILDAEKAGANVTTLSTQLNQATAFLAQAQNAYRDGDSQTALNYANTAVPIAQQVAVVAKSAETAAWIQAENAFFFSIASFALGVLVVALVLLWAWRFVKRKYIDRLSQPIGENS